MNRGKNPVTFLYEKAINYYYYYYYYYFIGKGHFLNKHWVLSGFIISEKGTPGRWKGGLMKRVACPKIWT